ncbi:MAG: response regulator transcription factor [Spirochaetales bacterium]|nr:response regulator transcription factor [Spirochaetales bacterium]
MINIVIVDDQDLVRESLEYILNSNPDLKVVGTAQNGIDGIKIIKNLNPNVVLMDLRMPGTDGIECIKILKEERPNVAVIALTTFDDDEYIYDSIKNGARGYLLKSIKSHDLVKAVRKVATGGSIMTPEVTTKVMQLFSEMAKADYKVKDNKSILIQLQTNEKKIIKLIGCGYSNKEISKELFLSEGTIRNYISSILQKLELRDRTQIAIFAVQNGLNINDE